MMVVRFETFERGQWVQWCLGNVVALSYDRDDAQMLGLYREDGLVTRLEHYNPVQNIEVETVVTTRQKLDRRWQER